MFHTFIFFSKLLKIEEFISFFFLEKVFRKMIKKQKVGEREKRYEKEETSLMHSLIEFKQKKEAKSLEFAN